MLTVKRKTLKAPGQAAQGEVAPVRVVINIP